MQGCFINGSCTEYVFISHILTLFMLIYMPLIIYVDNMLLPHQIFLLSFFSTNSCSLSADSSFLFPLPPFLSLSLFLFSLSFVSFFSIFLYPFLSLQVHLLASLSSLPSNPSLPFFIDQFLHVYFALACLSLFICSQFHIFIFMLDPCCHGFCWSTPDTVTITNWG